MSDLVVEVSEVKELNAVLICCIRFNISKHSKMQSRWSLYHFEGENRLFVFMNSDQQLS